MLFNFTGVEISNDPLACVNWIDQGDNQSLTVQVARRGIEPQSSCSASQELNHSATAAPLRHSEQMPRTVSSKNKYQFFCMFIEAENTGIVHIQQ